MLRKDFMIDPLQIVEARAAGADAVLLIVAALAGRAARASCSPARASSGSTRWSRCTTSRELERALAAGAELIGINNRDLHDFEIDVGVTRALLPRAAGRAGRVARAASTRPRRCARSKPRAPHAFLIGEALMREPDPGAALRRLRGAA